MRLETVFLSLSSAKIAYAFVTASRMGSSATAAKGLCPSIPGIRTTGTASEWGAVTPLQLQRVTASWLRAARSVQCEVQNCFRSRKIILFQNKAEALMSPTAEKIQ